MNKPAFVQLGVLALVVVAACEPDITLEEALQNAKCRGMEPKCVDGYQCDEGRNICVRDDASGGSGGTSAQSGAGGMPPVAANGGSAGVSLGGASGSGGGTAQGGSAGTSIDLPDGGVPQDAGGDGCVPGPLYVDIDGDGYGSGASPEFGCPHDNLVQNDDDCYDVDEEPMTLIQGETVHPGQTEYFIVGYRDTNKPDNRSFDYDCSGAEEADPDNAPTGRVPDCNAMPPASCLGVGFVLDARRPDGPGVNSACGSESIASCEISAGICVEGEPNSPGLLFGCR